AAGAVQRGRALLVRGEEIVAGAPALAVRRADALEVAVAVVVLPERTDGQSGLVLLGRQLEPAVGCRPRVPGGAERAVGVVFVQQVALARDEVAAQEEGAAGGLPVSGRGRRMCRAGRVGRR